MRAYVYINLCVCFLCNILTETLNKGKCIASTSDVQSYVAMYCARDVHTEFRITTVCNLTAEWNHRR
jgi:hypothetical protein